MRSLRELAPYEDDSRSRMGGTPAPANPIRRMSAPNPEQAFFQLDFLRSLQLHRRLALGIFLGALALSGAYAALRWNNYKAEGLVYVQPAPQRLLEGGSSQQWPYDANTYESYIQQQLHNVTRPDVLAAAVRSLQGFRGAKESEQAAADRLGGNLEVARVGTGYQISITATAGSAAEAARVANAVAESYITSATRELRSGDAQRIELLRDERDRVLKELASDRAEQEALNRQLGVAAVGSTPDPYDDQIAAVRSELVKARTANDEAAAKLMATAGGGLSSAALDAEADLIVAADPGLVSMKTALNKRRSDLISQMANLTPSHPIYKQDAEELAKINSSLESMSKELRAKAAAQIEQRLKSDLERTSSVEARLNAQLGQLTGAAGNATSRMQRATDLTTDIARLQNRFTTVDEQYRNLTIENAAPGAVYLSAPAIAPLHANRTKIYRNALAILLAGFVFALAAALIRHNLDPHIYIAADVERVLGFAPMALLPDLYEVGTSVAEEYMLRLAAAVEHAHQQGDLNSCIFTGVTPGAGATTVSVRVSSMLQAMGRETVLVDAVGAPPPREAMHPGTELVHAPRGSRSTALLQQMAEETGEETIVVTDTAPLLVSGETEYLARFVDSAIIVIESGTTTRAQLREVAQTLERLDVAAVGFVLNRISMEKANPGFRQSVRAVEKHLKAQSLAFERQIPRRENNMEQQGEALRRPSGYERLWEAVSEPAAEVVSAPPRTKQEPVSRVEEPESHSEVAHAKAPEVAEQPVFAEEPAVPQESFAPHPVGTEIVAPKPTADAAKVTDSGDGLMRGLSSEGAPAAAARVEETASVEPAPLAWLTAELATTQAEPARMEETPAGELALLAWLTAELALAPAEAAPVEKAAEVEPMPRFGAESETAATEAPEEPAYAALSREDDTVAAEPGAPVRPPLSASEHADEHELPSDLRRPQETAAEAVREPFLSDYIAPAPEMKKAAAGQEESVDRWLPNFVRKPSEIHMERLPESQHDQQPEPLLDTLPAEPLTAAPRPQPEAGPSNIAPRLAGAPDSSHVTASEIEETRFESWAPVSGVSPRPARGREGVLDGYGGKRGEPSSSEDISAGSHAGAHSETAAPVVAGPLAEPIAVGAVEHVSETVVQPVSAPVAPAEISPFPLEEYSRVRDSVWSETRTESLKEWWDDLKPSASPAVAPGELSAAKSAKKAGEPRFSAPLPQGEAGSSPASQTSDTEDLPYSAASRLSGLRNLLVSLGIQNLHQGVEQRKTDAPAEPRVERTPARPVYAQPEKPGVAGEEPPMPAEVTARPEIIPPSFNPDILDRTNEKKNPVKPPRVTRWDSPDDVEILPSRRGQYRRRY